MRDAELPRHRLARRVDVDADDDVRARHLRALHDVEANAAQPEHHDIVAGLDARGPDRRADAGGDAAADVTDLVERRVGADLGDRDLGHHGEVREGRAAHIMVQHLALVAEPRRAVGHHALALRRADLRAQIGLLAEARLTLAAFGRVQRDDMVADLDRGHARPDLADDAGAFMAEDATGTAPRCPCPPACRRRCGRYRWP